MDQTARIEDGRGNIIVQAVASSVTVGVPPQLKLSPRHRRKRAPKPGVDIDLLNPFTDAIPFIGREDDLARLQAWLAIPKLISARCLVGRAGAGKTRLALQLFELAEALAPAWDAGFVEHRELERFASLQNLSAWGWQRPTLIVVDYAAGVTRWLRPWLEELAQNPGRNGRANEPNTAIDFTPNRSRAGLSAQKRARMSSLSIRLTPVLLQRRPVA